MNRHIPEPDSRSDLEDEGIPDLQDGTPQQQRSEDPQEMPVPGEHPVAAADFGTTADEQAEGESLEGRLVRERADPAAAGDPDEAAREARAPSARATPDERVGRLVAPDTGGATDTEPDEVASDVGPDTGGFTAEEDAVTARPDDEQPSR